MVGWLQIARLLFEPTFHKHQGQLCSGVQIHVDDHSYDHLKFKPWRVQALALKALKTLYPQYELWRDFSYEYEHEKLPIDLINGGPALREWVDDPEAWAGDLCLLYTSPSPRDRQKSRMPSSA